MNMENAAGQPREPRGRGRAAIRRRRAAELPAFASTPFEEGRFVEVLDVVILHRFTLFHHWILRWLLFAPLHYCVHICRYRTMLLFRTIFCITPLSWVMPILV